MLAAGHDLSLGTADSTHSEAHSLKVNTTGAQRSGLHGMFGVSKATQTATETDVTPTGSLVGSTDGAVTLSAGQDVHITGSDVLSQTGTAIVGQNVSIDAAVGTVDGHQSQSLHTGGIMAGLTGGAATQAEQAWASGQRAGQASDTRLKALYAAQAAYGAHDAYKGGSAGVGSAGNGGGAQGAANASGVSLRIGIGASSAAAHSDTHDDIAYASHIQSAGDATIAATNGDLYVIGSQVSGNNVALAASHDLHLLSQAEQHTQKDSSANASGEVGISIGSTTGIYLSAAGGLSRAHGNGETHTDSVVSASDTLSLISGHDATIQGAQAKGNTVLADIGGNLNLASEQDTNDYASKNAQAGITLVYGFSGGGVGVSGSLAYGQMDSDYASVTQVSGIAAGDGGYQLHVGGNTDLKGAVIASTADAAKNLLSTGSLSYSDIDNQAHYDAFSVSVSGGGSIPQSGSEHSTTRAGIAQGAIEVRDNPSQDLSGLDRHPDIDAAGLKTLFDQQKVAEQRELGQVAGYVGMRSVGALAQMHTKPYTDAATQAAKDEALLASGTLDSEQQQATLADLDAQKQLMTSSQAEYDAWKDGSTNKVLLHGLVGAATAALGGGNGLQGALGAAAGEAGVNAMRELLAKQGINPDSSEGRSLMDMASAAIGAVAGGGSGAVTALDGEKFNQQLHPDVLKELMGKVAAFAKEYGLSEEEAQNRLLLEAMRLQDTGLNLGTSTDQIGGSAGLPDDAMARAFLAANNDFTVNGDAVDIFKPEAPDDSSRNAYALYDYLDQNPGMEQAFYDAQVAGYAQRGWTNTASDQAQQLAHWANQDVIANYMVDDKFHEETVQFLKFNGLLAASGGAAAVAAASPVFNALFTGYNIYGGADQVQQGHYVLGGLQMAGGMLGVGGLARQGSQVAGVGEALWSPLGGTGGVFALGGNGVGKIIGSTDGLTVAEQGFVNEMVAGGRTVEVIPTSTGRTADFLIDGQQYELKTMTNVSNQTSDGLSKAISTTAMDARGQSGNTIIDARNQAGMTADIANRGVARAYSADTRSGAKIQSITIITKQGTVYAPRTPK